MNSQPSPSLELPENIVALSIKQPWATLIVHGIKTLEIRRWATKRTGLVYIHTGKGIEKSDEAWNQVPAQFLPTTEHRGGLIGTVEIVGCKKYLEKDAFAADQDHHRVPQDWFPQPPVFGFEMSNPQTIDYIACKGNLYFFTPTLPGR